MADLVPNKKMSLSEKLSIIDKAISATNKKYGKTIMGRIGKSPEIMDKLMLKFVPTPSTVYNKATGGGWPRGRLSIITGGKDAGKTSILLDSAAFNMRNDDSFTVLWLESENSLKKEWVVDMFHIDPDRFVLIPLNPKEVGTESTLDIIEGLISTKAFDMVVINSLRCLIPDQEKEKKFGEATVASQARLNSKLMRKWTPLISEADCAFCVVQHLFTDINSYGAPKVLAGGEAFKYWASLIVEHTTAGMGATKSAGIPLDEKGAPMGALYNVKIKKNHCIPESPHQYAKFSYCVVFGEGVEEISPCIDIGLEKGILEKHGAWIYWMDDNGKEKAKYKSRAAFRDALKSDEKLWKEFHALVSDEAEQVESLSADEIAAIEKEDSGLINDIKNEKVS